MVYLSILAPAFSNDLWWSGYNVSTHQALLIDLFNTYLTTHANGSLDLLDASMGKAYDTAASSTSVYPTYVRGLVYNELTSIDFAIIGLRSMDAMASLQLCTQYCWVDLNHTFEIAHTSERQARCDERYSTNGAVYMETVLRNQDWDDILVTWGPWFTGPIQDYLLTIPRGRTWLEVTSSALTSTTVAQESDFWGRHNLTTFQLQWQNMHSAAISETLVIVNAFGMEQTIVSKNVAGLFQPSEWTSFVMYNLPFNDLGALVVMNRSFIRGSPNSFTQPPVFNFEDSLGLYDASGVYVRQVEAFQLAVGPFDSIDMFYVAAPLHLVELVNLFHAKLDLDMHAIDDFSVEVVVPSAWTNPDWLFYGGNPMCFYGGPLPYVQLPFGFTDNCAIQLPFVVPLTKYSSVFAAMMTREFSIRHMCRDTTDPVCVRQFHQVWLTTANLPSTMLASMLQSMQCTTDAVTRLKVSIMQYASNKDASKWTLLSEPILQDPIFGFFGWAFLYDWVQGTREVVSFEGDVASLVLMSMTEARQESPTSTNSIKTATQYIYYLVVYITATLTLVGLLCLGYTSITTNRIEGRHLLWFNRVVGSIWIGRPLLFVRGATSMFLLSTSQLQLTTDLQRSHFQLEPRSWFGTLVVCGEATWVLYVVQDFLTVVDHECTYLYNPLSCFMSWLSLFMLDVCFPLKPVVQILRRCTSPTLDAYVECTVGTIQIGSLDRVYLIFGMQLAAFAIAVLSVRVVVANAWVPSRVYPFGTASVLLATQSDTLDPVSRVLTGVLTFTWRGVVYSFDLKLWLLKVEHDSTAVILERCRSNQTEDQRSPPTTTSFLSAKYGSRLHAFLLVIGLGHIFAAIGSSVVYLQVSKRNLSNDLFWVSFNMTGAHAFLATWFNQNLMLGVTQESVVDMHSAWINQDANFAQAITGVNAAPNFGALMQYAQLNGLDTAIAGLRSTNPCVVPWIFTPYCFVDFNQQWEMANSASRQLRCQAMITNGAVFLESVLRNIQFDEFQSCWGNAFDLTIANELRTSQRGQMWLATISSGPRIPIANEISVWRNHNIQTFETQWQNFKRIGLVNDYTVTNMFGLSYPFTLQAQNTTYRLDKQSTYKMYWGFANDLAAISANTSGIIGGQSLVRSSSNFAFDNTSLEAMLVENGTLSIPLSNTFMLVKTTLGPFGSVDMVYIPCPIEAKGAVRGILRVFRTVLSNSTQAQVAYSKVTANWGNPTPAPKSWTELGFVAAGGSILCPEVMAGTWSPISSGLQGLVSWDVECSPTGVPTYLFLGTENMLLATVLANINSSIAGTNACARDITYYSSCLVMMNQTMSFLSTYVPSIEMTSMSQAAARATLAIQSLNVEFVQFGTTDPTNGHLSLYRLNVLDPNEVDFTFFAWVFLIDWVMGNRDAISFQGDVGSMVLLSEYINELGTPINLNENRVNLSKYLRSAVLYVTYSMMAMAILMVVYCFICRAHIEVWNLFLVERVGAIVWIGRPLLFARSLTAIGLLSTSTLQLCTTGYISYFDVPEPSILYTLLEANEITWLVVIVNDIALAFTQEYTRFYAPWDGLFLWCVTACLSLWSPVSHSVTIDKQCHVTQMDAQVVCTSANVTIGHVSRLLTLVVISISTNVAGYVLTRLWFRRTPLKARFGHSALLYGGAKYLFSTSNWIRGNIYDMDRMSAVLNGIITLQWHQTIYGLDVKLWQTFRMEVPIDEMGQRAVVALPITLHCD
ncbi:Aste57867_6013 [Aphanomyces stellatus]|nr:hypothetical protein As57867_005998 [Aphanomyces stellatus]KAF0709272.1 hypothetical protein As57867_005999 [Aphanomyces stellatus]VFT83026.1 Aste57867_6012 [Aphanomyces stellatus]VFT83027.1 Aste57867_6013 [Aphanomyces stellatus]